jgi:hypothetical protein
MQDYLGMLLGKIRAVIKPAIWTFIPTIVAQVRAALASRNVEKILALANRLEATAIEEREHADSLDALASHLKQIVADGHVDGIEMTEGLKLLQTSLDELEDVIKGSDEDDAPPVLTDADAAADLKGLPRPDNPTA